MKGEGRRERKEERRKKGEEITQDHAPPPGRNWLGSLPPRFEVYSL